MSIYKKYSIRMGYVAWFAFAANLMLLLFSIVFALELLTIGSILLSLYLLFLQSRIREKCIIGNTHFIDAVSSTKEDLNSTVYLLSMQSCADLFYLMVVVTPVDAKGVKALQVEVSKIKCLSKGLDIDLKKFVVKINQKEPIRLDHYCKKQTKFVKTPVGSLFIN